MKREEEIATLVALLAMCVVFALAFVALSRC